MWPGPEQMSVFQSFETWGVDSEPDAMGVVPAARAPQGLDWQFAHADQSGTVIEARPSITEFSSFAGGTRNSLPKPASPAKPERHHLRVALRTASRSTARNEAVGAACSNFACHPGAAGGIQIHEFDPHELVIATEPANYALAG